MSTHKLTVVVLGAGNIGGTLGRKWIPAGHRVAFGVSNPEGPKAQALHSDLGHKITLGLGAEVLATNPDVVVMALPGGAMDEVIETYAPRLDGRIIIDAANRMGGGPANSFASLQKYTPKAHIFRAFNTLGWENFANPVFGDIRADLFYCGPDGEPRAVVERLITDVGLDPVRLGDVDAVGLVDSVASLWFALAFGQKKGRDLAFKVLMR